MLLHYDYRTTALDTTLHCHHVDDAMQCLLVDVAAPVTKVPSDTIYSEMKALQRAAYEGNRPEEIVFGIEGGHFVDLRHVLACLLQLSWDWMEEESQHPGFPRVRLSVSVREASFLQRLLGALRVPEPLRIRDVLTFIDLVKRNAREARA